MKGHTKPLSEENSRHDSFPASRSLTKILPRPSWMTCAGVELEIYRLQMIVRIL
jgi:hypothetical protein